MFPLIFGIVTMLSLLRRLQHDFDIHFKNVDQHKFVQTEKNLLVMLSIPVDSCWNKNSSKHCKLLVYLFFQVWLYVLLLSDHVFDT